MAEFPELNVHWENDRPYFPARATSPSNTSTRGSQTKDLDCERAEMTELTIIDKFERRSTSAVKIRLGLQGSNMTAKQRCAAVGTGQKWFKKHSQAAVQLLLTLARKGCVSSIEVEAGVLTGSTLPEDVTVDSFTVSFNHHLQAAVQIPKVPLSFKPTMSGRNPPSAPSVKQEVSQQMAVQKPQLNTASPSEVPGDRVGSLEMQVGRLSNDVAELKTLIKKCLGSQRTFEEDATTSPEPEKMVISESVQVPQTDDTYSRLLNECVMADLPTVDLFRYVFSNPSTATLQGYEAHMANKQTGSKSKPRRPIGSKSKPALSNRRAKTKRAKKGVSVRRKKDQKNAVWSFMDNSEDEFSIPTKKSRFGRPTGRPKSRFGRPPSGRPKKPVFLRPQKATHFEDQLSDGLEDIFPHVPQPKQKLPLVLQLSDSSSSYEFSDSDFNVKPAEVPDPLDSDDALPMSP